MPTGWKSSESYKQWYAGEKRAQTRFALSLTDNSVVDASPPGASMTAVNGRRDRPRNLLVGLHDVSDEPRTVRALRRAATPTPDQAKADDALIASTPAVAGKRIVYDPEGLANHPHQIRFEREAYTRPHFGIRELSSATTKEELTLLA
eukprot:TRINITY_DN13048_c0_g1_i1.p1 TRINITY_DN13048_c0_g1~~TRINITY_DN13048_c0_g1_i1.p1  ORF type:complete len:148 (-),score=42.43 TRINITY_DN13048_c0_g1_i1:114-557(-)